MRLDFNTVRTHYPDALESGDGAIHFLCPICEAEGHPGKDFTVFTNGATSCVRAAAAGRDFNREHCRPVREQLGLGVEKTAAFINEILFDGTLTLECDTSKSDKARTVARNCKDELHRDVIDLNRFEHRKSFVKALAGYDDEQQIQINHALLRLAGRRESVQAVTDDEEEDKAVEKVISKQLPDGRIIEQIAGGQFAVYDPASGEVTYHKKVETDEAVYRPLDDNFILKGGLFLPERLIKYGDVATLDAEIEACIYRYSDVPERERKLSAKYARLSYLTDVLDEISYLRATGDRGSGKSRYICTSGMICLRPIIVVSPSAASLFRMMDAFHPTLIIDEFNLETGSEDTDVLMKILNAGYQRVGDQFKVKENAQ